MFRKTIFWIHLGCGVFAGLVILMMSFTGVVLTYERQIEAWAEQQHYVPESAQTARLSLEQLQFIALTEHSDFTPSTLVVLNDPGAPVSFTPGRRGGGGGINLNPYTGEEMETSSPALETFFSTTTAIHRRFNVTGDNRNLARGITSASNLMFLFLLISGLYLWFPKIWNWGMFRIRFAFRGTAGNSKARDFNWHHVFGIWSVIPLIFVVTTATVFYYPWANNLLYQVYGEEPPSQGQGPAPATRNISAQENVGSVPFIPEFHSSDQLFINAASYIEQSSSERSSGWRQISLTLPEENSRTVRFVIDQGNGGEPHKRHALVLSRETGEVTNWEPFSSQSRGSQTRSIVRYLHTGEALGILGQTIAGLVSLTSLFMVWTGLALAWRRLISPLYRKKSVPAA
ncbi:MAG: PepSY-associated TM helix domain-containing protein [Gammaproteobacteria bacterium]|nr:PepSY-associated TM helix domain-containing protein [Gammaproteobacteria bacterium]